MSIPHPNHQGTYVRNFLTIFVCISIVAYLNYQIDEATSDINIANGIINSMLKNQTYSIKQQRLYQLQNSLKAKQYSQLSQTQCMVRIYLDVLNNEKFTSQTLQKTDQSATTKQQVSDNKVQLTFTELVFPTTAHDLQGFKSCSDILTLMNFLNPAKTDFIYSNFMQQKYGSFILQEDNEMIKDQNKNQEKNNKFCILSYQTNTSSHKLHENINSLIEQSYQNYKLVVLDNGSTDGSYEIAKVILQDLKQKLIQENKLKEKQIKEKYQIVHEKSKLGLWELFRKYDSHCQGSDYVVFVDGRDELSTIHALNLINRKIIAQKQKPYLITSPILKKKQLSRQSPAQVGTLNNTKNIPTFTFKILSSELYQQIKQKTFEQTRESSHPYQAEVSFVKNSFQYCVENNKSILEIDEMLYVYDTIQNKQIDRNQYFIGTYKQNAQKSQSNEHSSPQ